MKWTQVATTAGIAAGALVIGLVTPGLVSASPTPQPAAKHNAAIRAKVVTPKVKVESTFTSISPCRIVDTRSGGGAFASSAVRSYFVAGTTGFAPQGGKSGGCGIPTSATAIAATVSSVAPGADGYVRAYPSALATDPAASVLSYTKGHSSGSGGAISITPAVAQGLKVKNYGGPTQIIIDVTGYYAPQIQGYISPDGTLGTTSSRIVSATKSSTGEYDVVIDRDITNCTPFVTIEGGYYYGDAYSTGTTTVHVETWGITGGSSVATDLYYQLYVSC